MRSNSWRVSEAWEVAHDREMGRVERDIVSWEHLDGLVAGLASRLTGEFDLLLAITRGGLVPAGMLAYRLRIRTSSSRPSPSMTTRAGPARTRRSCSSPPTHCCAASGC